MSKKAGKNKKIEKGCLLSFKKNRKKVCQQTLVRTILSFTEYTYNNFLQNSELVKGNVLFSPMGKPAVIRVFVVPGSGLTAAENLQKWTGRLISLVMSTLANAI